MNIDAELLRVVARYEQSVGALEAEVARLNALLGERDAKIAEMYGFRSHYDSGDKE